MFVSLLRYVSLFLFLTISGVDNVYSQDARQEFMIRGKVYSGEDSIPLQLINVIDQHSHLGVPSGLDGSFNIAVSEGDSIRFSSVGYIDFYLVVKSNSLKEGIKIYLKTANYELMPITVTPYGERVLLRKSFAELSRREKGDTVHISLRTGTSGASPPSSAGFSIGWDPLGNSIRKQNAAIAQWIRKQEMDSLAAKKFSKAFVQQIIDIPDEEVEDFMTYCNLKSSYILSVTQYDLAQAIIKYYRSYRVQNHRASQHQDIREY